MEIPTRSTALHMRLSEFRGWHLLLSCEPCRMLTQLDVERLAAAHGGALVGEVVRRLRCSRCGAPAATVDLADGIVGAGRASVREISLHPP